MTSSTILRTTTPLLVTLFLVFSLFLLWRGHNEPGGGFAGGLVAGAAFSLYSIAYGSTHARLGMLTDPRMLIGIGIGIAGLSGIPSLLLGDPFAKALWWDIEVVGREVKLGTPLLFDVGVYFAVIGVVTTIVFALGEEED